MPSELKPEDIPTIVAALPRVEDEANPTLFDLKTAGQVEEELKANGSNIPGQIRRVTEAELEVFLDGVGIMPEDLFGDVRISAANLAALAHRLSRVGGAVVVVEVGSRLRAAQQLEADLLPTNDAA